MSRRPARAAVITRAEPEWTRPAVLRELAEAAAAYGTAKRAAREAQPRLAQAVQIAVANGISEAETARLAGVTRMTVRAWLGKQNANGDTPSA